MAKQKLADKLTVKVVYTRAPDSSERLARAIAVILRAGSQAGNDDKRPPGGVGGNPNE